MKHFFQNGSIFLKNISDFFPENYFVFFLRDTILRYKATKDVIVAKTINLGHEQASMICKTVIESNFLFEFSTKYFNKAGG